MSGKEKTKCPLILKGGGIKGIAFVGALKELRAHYDFNWYAGTSAGAITAILLASGYTVGQLEKLVTVEVKATGEKGFQRF